MSSDRLDNTLPFPTRPGGTVTFLFTDIEGSTELLKRLREEYAELLAEQRAILRACFEKWSGHEVDTQGDSFFVAFPRATEALGAAVEILRALQEHPWPEEVQVRVRMGLHTGEPWLAEEGYVGIDVHRAARISSVGHGGQVLLSETTAALVRDELPQGVSLLELGRHRLKDIHRPEPISQLVIEGLPGEFPPLKSLDAGMPAIPPHSFPSELTPFVGRARELSSLEALMADPAVRLLTILGPGGMGKSRLALAIAERQVMATRCTNGSVKAVYPDGVFFIPLASLESVDSIVPSLAEVIGFRLSEQRDPLKQLIGHICEKEMLIILDNFEHLVDGCGLIVEMLKSVSRVKLVVTSRVQLNVGPEHCFHLQGLDLPKAIPDSPDDAVRFGSIELFRQCARRANADFKIVDENLGHVLRICKLLEGTPLGIRIASTWIGMLSPEEIVAEIQAGLDLLETDVRDLPERHRSISAVFEHSWRLLSERERSVLAGLSVFRGGFDREAASQIAGASLRDMKSLIAKSLVSPSDSGRYVMHDLLRQCASQKLLLAPDEYKTTQKRHGEYFAMFLRSADSALKGARQKEGLTEIEAELGNTLKAWNWALESSEVQQLDQAADGLFRFHFWRRRYVEAEKLCAEAARALRTAATSAPNGQHGEPHRLLAKILTWQSIFSGPVGGRKLIEEALTLLENPGMADVDCRAERAFASLRAGDLSIDSDPEEAERRYEVCLKLGRELDDCWGRSRALTALGWVAVHAGRSQDAIDRGEESMALCRSSGDQKGLADAMWLLGTTAILGGQVDRACHLINESLEIRDELGDRIIDIAPGPVDLGMTLTWIGRMEEANAVREETLRLFQEEGLPEQVAMAHVRLAYSKLHLGHFEDAMHHARLGVEMCKKVGDLRGEGLALFIIYGAQQLQAGDADESILAEGISTLRSLEGAQELGWGLAFAAEFYTSQGQVGIARDYMLEALRTRSGLLGMITALWCIPSHALHLANRGEKKRALELFAQVSRYPIVRHSRTFQGVFKSHFEAIATSMTPQEVAEAQALGRARTMQETIEEILDGLERDVQG